MSNVLTYADIVYAYKLLKGDEAKRPHKYYLFDTSKDSDEIEREFKKESMDDQSMPNTSLTRQTRTYNSNSNLVYQGIKAPYKNKTKSTIARFYANGSKIEGYYYDPNGSLRRETPKYKGKK
jgi:hypothetical protein